MTPNRSELLRPVSGGRSRRTMRLAMMMCKGGVGKTTTTLFASQRLAMMGARVLAIDSDPQANLTAALQPSRSGYVIGEKTPVLLDVMTGKCRLSDAILELTPNLHVLPSTAINSLLERRLLQAGEMPVFRLHRLLREVEGQYDYILIDSAPSLNLINAAIVYASDFVILPVQLDEFARMGLHQTISEIRDLEAEFGFQTQVRILLNRFNPRDRAAFVYLGHLAEQYRPYMLNSTIRASLQIRRAIASRADLFARPTSNAASDLTRLANEIMDLNASLEGRSAGL